MRFFLPAAVSLALAVGVAPTAHAAVIAANNPPPGDFYTNAGPTNQGQPVGASGWYYNNVRNGGVVGINTTYLHVGSPTLYFNTPSGAAKADGEFLANGVNVLGNYAAAGSLGNFSAFSAASYDWYRDSASTTAANFHLAMRILLDADGNLATTGDRGGLVFERAYNTPSGVPTDAWTSDAIGAGTFLWNFGLGIGTAANINATPYAYDATLAEWQAFFPNAAILGFSVGAGSGWNGTFLGAADNIRWTIGGQTTTNTFAVPAAIPEPTSLALFGGAALAAGYFGWRRRKPTAD